MKIEIKVPSVGESVNEAILAQWYKSDGAAVSKDEPLFAIETDKVTLEVVAEASGLLNITVQEGETVDIGAVVGTIDTEAAVSDTPTEETPGEVSEAANHITEPPPTEIQPAAEGPEKPAEAQKLSPSVRRLIAEKGVPVEAIKGTGPGDRVTKGDVLTYLERVLEPGSAPPVEPETATVAIEAAPVDLEEVVRKPIVSLRIR